MSAAPKFKNNVKISERHGAGEWKVEKLALAALMPLGLWVLSTGFTLAGTGYDAVVAWFGSALNAGLLAVTALVFFLFASLAWKVIIEDYVPASSRSALIRVSNLVFLVLAAASIFFIVRVAMGSAPLPAGV
ncbi:MULTISPECIES: succinate dehydrogenase, hydrophobic membrane anchor protein [unclassified Brevundimonas]|uniref:succinate dehydrogenase, hydrophobic membrane anchor protein n=1 Tax=unclassified Brevundimonas TaxID=2622653 RepID=UPI003F92597E